MPNADITTIRAGIFRVEDTLAMAFDDQGKLSPSYIQLRPLANLIWPAYLM